MKRFLSQTAIFVAIATALFLVYGTIRSGSHARFLSTSCSAAVVFSLPAMIVSAVSLVWRRVLWSAITGSILVPFAVDVTLKTIASLTPAILLSLSAIGAAAAAASHWLGEKFLGCH